jgi:hypothetical protein
MKVEASAQIQHQTLVLHWLWSSPDSCSAAGMYFEYSGASKSELLDIVCLHWLRQLFPNHVVSAPRPQIPYCRRERACRILLS